MLAKLKYQKAEAHLHEIFAIKKFNDLIRIIFFINLTVINI